MRLMGLVAMVILLVGCEINLGPSPDDEDGRCFYWLGSAQMYVPCSWCREGAGAAAEHRCVWEPSE